MNNPAISSVYLTSKCLKLSFTGDSSYVKQSNVCPNRNIKSKIFRRDRFSRSIDENLFEFHELGATASDNDVESQYNRRKFRKLLIVSKANLNYSFDFLLDLVINSCNDVNNTNYNVLECWQTFDVQYAVYFRNVTELTSGSPKETILKYQRLFLKGLIPWQNGSLLSALLLKKDSDEKIYLK